MARASQRAQDGLCVRRAPQEPVMDPHRYFIAVTPRDTLDAAMATGYVEVNHGKAAPLERMRDGDAVLFYSPRESEGGKALQSFTALARIRGDALYQARADGDSERPF